MSVFIVIFIFLFLLIAEGIVKAETVLLAICCICFIVFGSGNVYYLGWFGLLVIILVFVANLMGIDVDI